MDIDWKNKPTFEDYPNAEVVWVEAFDSCRSKFHVHLKCGEVERYLDSDGGFWTVDLPESDNTWYKVYRDPRDKYERGLAALDKAMQEDLVTELSQLREEVAKLKAALVKINNLSPESNDSQYISDYESQVMCIAYEAMDGS
jgi:hypothetical protein